MQRGLLQGVTNSEGGGASAGRTIVALATSHGFSGAYSTSGYSVSASVIAGEGDGMERDYAYDSVRHLEDLERCCEHVGKEAGERAVSRLNPVEFKSGAMPVVYDPRVGNTLLGHLHRSDIREQHRPENEFSSGGVGNRSVR